MLGGQEAGRPESLEAEKLGRWEGRRRQGGWEACKVKGEGQKAQGSGRESGEAKKPGGEEVGKRRRAEDEKIRR